MMIDLILDIESKARGPRRSARKKGGDPYELHNTIYFLQTKILIIDNTDELNFRLYVDRFPIIVSSGGGLWICSRSPFLFF